MRQVARGVVFLGVGLLAACATGCEHDSPVVPTQCTFSVDPASRSFTALAAEGTVAVAASDPSCAWVAVESAAWVTVAAPASGVGSGVVRYSVAANTPAGPRAASLTIGTATHTIVQAQAEPPPPCAYDVDPAELSVTADSVVRQVRLTTSAECSWEASSGAAWLVVTPPTTGLGSALIELRIDANRSETPRTSAVTIGGHTVFVTQAGEPAPAACDYAVSPVVFTPCMDGGGLVTRITTAASCTWTVSASVPWLTITTATAGAGSGDVRAQYSSNFDAPRNGQLLVRWPSPTAGQNVQVNQAGCRYGVSRSQIDLPAAAGNAAFDVLQQSDPTECGGATQDRCVWSAVADVPWIQITTAMPKTGDDRVSFTASLNATGQSRTGRILVRDQRVIVTQAGQ